MRPALVGQAARFALVGGAATLAHVGTALAVGGGLGWAPGGANLAGYALAVGVSYLGHGRLTFGMGGDHARRLPRFLAVSLTGLVVSAAITHLVCAVMGGSLTLAMAAVVAVVPAASFAASRAWVFVPSRPAVGGPPLARPEGGR